MPGRRARHVADAASPHHPSPVPCLATRPAVDGSKKEIDLKNKSAEEVGAVLAALRNSATGVTRSLARPVVSNHPSVQGVWDASTTFDSFKILS